MMKAVPFSTWQRYTLPPPTRTLIALAAALIIGGCANPGATSSTPTTPATTHATLSGAQIAQLLASPDRREADRTNDIRRKPADMLAFIGVRPGMVALDVVAGGGYTTELIARAFGPTGRVYGQSAPRNPTPPAAPLATPEGNSHPNLGNPATATAPAAPAAAQAASPATPPRPSSPQMLAERAKNPAAGNIVAVVQKYDNPVPAELASSALDLVTLMFNYHDLAYQPVDRAQMNKSIFAALKPGGTYVIADHAAKAGTGTSVASTLHRIEEAFVVREVEAAGFRLVASADFLRNPNDPRDRNTPDPPMPKDEFVLKFVKP
jgi:predicted methyltransferase